MRRSAYYLLLSSLLAVRTAEVDYATKMQQAVGTAKIAVQQNDITTALDKIGTMKDLLVAWETALEAKRTAAAAPKEPEEAPTPPEESIEYSMNRTYVPEKCPRTSADGSVMKVHYVGKLLKTNKIFSSSFHTGSQPLRFVLGSDEVIGAWNEGLQDMCEGERRRLMVPWTKGYGKKGSKGVPPYSDLQYDFELVELSTRGSKAAEKSAEKGAKKGKGKGKGKQEL